MLSGTTMALFADNIFSNCSSDISTVLVGMEYSDTDTRDDSAMISITVDSFFTKPTTSL